MSGHRSRNKGKRGEREVIGLMQLTVFEIYKAHELECPRLQRNTLQSDRGGYDIVGIDWLALEVKYQETLQLDKWWKQTIEQAMKGEPVLVYRSNHQPWRVMMHALLGGPGAGVTVPVIVDFDSFLRWFRIRLSQELAARNMHGIPIRRTPR
jgi:hypothetical protein